MNRSSSVTERPSVPLQPLHDEALTTEEAGADLFVKSDADAHSFGSAQKCVLLRDQLTANLGQMHRDDLSRVRRAEGHLLATGGAILKNGHEERFAHQQALARAHQRAHKAAALL